LHFNIYDVFYSKYYHQHVSVGIPVIFRVMFLLHLWLTVSPSLHNNYNYKISVKII